MDLTPEQQIQLVKDVAEIKRAVFDINGRFKALPCTTHNDDIKSLNTFRDNLQGKIGIISAISVVVGGFLMWLAEEIIRKFLGKV